MKKISIFLSLFAFYAASASAQYVLTAATTNPVVNNAYTTVNCDTTGTFSQATILADTGANITWDYSGLLTISYDTAKEVTCGSTPHCGLFLSSTNYASQTLSNSSYVYSILSTDSAAITGYYYSINQNYVLTDPLINMKYPFTYHSSYSDNYGGTITYYNATYGITLTAIESGVINVYSDGYGTLRLPGGVTDTGVLRVRSSQNFRDSAHVLTIDSVATFQLNTYDWFMPNYHSPLMTITFTDQLGVGSAGVHFKTISYAKFYPLDVQSLNVLESSLQVYPNPASEEMNIKFENAGNEKIAITLVDLLGRVVATVPFLGQQGAQLITLNTHSIPKGCYVLRVQSGGENLTRKVSIL